MNHDFQIRNSIGSTYNHYSGCFNNGVFLHCLCYHLMNKKGFCSYYTCLKLS